MKPGWTTAVLGDVAVIERRGIDPSSLKGDTVYLGLEHIESGGRLIGRSTVRASAVASTKFRFGPEHLLFGKLRPYLGKITAPDFSGVCSTDILPIRPGPRLDRQYLLHFLRQPSVVAHAASRATGANLPRLSPSELAGFELPLPPIEEQRRIAAILDQADSLQAHALRSLQMLQLLRDGYFLQFLERAQVRQVPFGEATSRITVGVVIRPASHYVPIGVPALRTFNVKPGRLDLQDLVYFSSEANDGPLRKSRLKADDLLIARTGKPGTCALVPSHLDGANAIDLIVASADRTQAEPEYLMRLLNSKFGRQLVAGERRGQIQQHFNVGSLRAARVPLPSRDDQRTFVNQDRVISDRFAVAESHHERLAELSASLQARAFSGRL